jgi:hypothetical protein
MLVLIGVLPSWDQATAPHPLKKLNEKKFVRKIAKGIKK